MGVSLPVTYSVMKSFRNQSPVRVFCKGQTPSIVQDAQSTQRERILPTIPMTLDSWVFNFVYYTKVQFSGLCIYLMLETVPALVPIPFLFDLSDWIY